eukprot:COSAG02_NODE_63013_length_264_cov_0.727273_1_plen_27_part_10
MRRCCVLPHRLRPSKTADLAASLPTRT